MRNCCFYIFLFLQSFLLLGQIDFTDVTIQKGIHHSYESGLSGGGVSCIDLNNDGWADLTLASTDGADFYIYQPETQRFNELEPFGINLPPKVKQILWVDWNKDQLLDLFASSESGVYAFQNVGSFHFIEVTDSIGIDFRSVNSFGIAVADINRDGWLDFYFTEKELGGNVQNQFYLNDKGLRLIKQTEQYSIVDPNKKPYIPAFFDFDNDLFPDLYIAQDRQAGNSVFHNDNGISFEDIGLTSRANEVMDGMSVSLIDFNRDGYQDFYVANIEAGNRFFINNQDLTFTESADRYGIEYFGVAWGTNFLDLDNDGDEDLYVVGSLDERSFQNTLYENIGNDFRAMQPQNMQKDTAISYSTGYADFNQDGKLDLVVNNTKPYTSTVWQNNSQAGNWIAIELHGIKSNKEAIGSHVMAYQSGIKTSKYTMVTEGYLTQNTHTLHFGLGSGLILDSLQVVWPLGDTSVFYELDGNRLYHLLEPNQQTWLYDVDTVLCGNASTWLKAGYAKKYQWNTGSTLDRLEVTEPGLYILNTELHDGTIIIDSILIEQRDFPDFEIQISENLCAGSARATIEISTLSSQSILWQDGFRGNFRTDLGSGDYPIYIYDEFRCGTDTVVSITNASSSDLQAFIKYEESEDELKALVVGGQPPYSFYWIFESDTISQDNKHQPKKPGIYQLIVQDDNGCHSTFSYNYLFDILSVKSDLPFFYPNPVHDWLTISPSLSEISTIDVFQSSGQHFMTIQPEIIQEKKLDLSSLKAGLYILTLTFKDQSIIHAEIIKE